jgi:hypothetical protein
MPAAAPPIATPAKATTTQGMPTLPAAQPQPSYTPPTNVGTYSGYNGSTTGLGYAPRQEANMSGTDWATYGQGPEQQFFQPAGTQQASPPPMMQVNQGTITRANST